MMRHSNIVRGILFSLIGIAITIYLLRQIDLNIFTEFLSRMNYFWLYAGFATYIVVYIFRAFRWQAMLLSKNVKVSTLFFITMAHTMLTHLLPARTGELSYAYFLKKQESIAMNEGLATLVFARILDLACLGLYFLLSLLMNWQMIQVPILKIVLITLVSFPLFIVLLMFLFSSMGIEKIEKVFKRLGLMKNKFLERFMGWMREFSTAFDNLRKSGKLLRHIILTLLIWGAKFLAFYFILRSFNLPLEMTFWATVFGTTFTEIAAILPLYGIAGIGTIEGGWTVGFLLLGLPKDIVIASGFCFHILLLMFAILLGCIGLIQIWRSRTEKGSTPRVSIQE